MRDTVPNKHPSYGLLSFARTTGGVTNLFGSSIQHRDTIRLRISEGEISRTISNEFYSDNDKLIEVEMSYSQFAEAITSLNQGAGVPVTLRYIKELGIIEPCPFIDKKKQLEDEFAETLKGANEKIHQLIRDTEVLFAEKKNITKADREMILSNLHRVEADISSNANFVFEKFNEQADKTVMEAKGEIEAFMQNKIATIANRAMVEYRQELEHLENPIEMQSINSK